MNKEEVLIFNNSSQNTKIIKRIFSGEKLEKRGIKMVIEEGTEKRVSCYIFTCMGQKRLHVVGSSLCTYFFLHYNNSFMYFF